MTHIAYLEPDDELTSAAARIRQAPGDRVGLVLPFNSRVATSRINFRLLAREAADAGRILDVIAPDAAARALAISAGLRAFATVGEYEAEMDGVAAASSGSGSRWVEDVAIGSRGVPARPETEDQWVWEPVRPPEYDAHTWSAQVKDPKARPPKGAGGAKPLASLRLMGAILALAVLVGMGGAAGAMLLPAAEITVTAKVEAVPAITFAVTADPAIAAPDAGALRIPAQAVPLPVHVSGDYPATGKKVTETKASGQVEFLSINTVFPVSVAKGTRVSTLDGVVFATTAAAVVPKATVSGTTIKRGTVMVGIAAIKGGLAGNVAASTITQAPGTLATQQIAVSNPAATTGGTHTETLVVSQADVDAALKDLNARLKIAFDGVVIAPPGLPAGTVSYPATAVLGAVTPDTDPATLAGTKADTFSLSLAATGSILAVDAAPIRAIGEAAVGRAVLAGYRLVPGSVTVQVGTGVPADGTVSFDVRASGTRVRVLDASTLRQQVLGRSEAVVMAALGQYGNVELHFWPGWVDSVPTNVSRVTLTVIDSAPGAGPDSSQSPVPSGS